MKRILALCCAALLLLSLSGAETAAKAAAAHQYEDMWNGDRFDLACFRQRKNLFAKDKKQWKITVSEEDEYGSIIPVTSKAKQNFYAAEIWIYPEILLDSYGTPGFMPLVNLRIVCRSDYNYSFTRGSIKIGSKEFKFSNAPASTEENNGKYTATVNLFFDVGNKAIASQWISAKGDIRLHLDGRRGDFIEFPITKDTQKNVKALLQDYAKAGGDIADYRIVQGNGIYTVFLAE